MMEADSSEALRAKEMAEKQLVKKEFADAKMYALKACSLCPSLDGISQMLATLDVYMASQVKVNGEADFYAILGVNPLADDESVKQQYRKLALKLHPDKNKTVGAEGAFKFVSEAWSTLSNSSRRALYDQRRSMSLTESPRKVHSCSNQASTVNGSRKRPKSSDSNGCTKRSTFWTTCSSCKMQFEYLRIYVNRNLTCQNCWHTFIAVETGKSPTSISTPFVPSTTPQRNDHVRTENNCGTYYTANSFHYVDGEISAFPCGIVTENTPHVTVQWVPLHGSVANIHVSPVAPPPMVVSRSYEKAKRASEIPRSTERDLNTGSPGVASYHAGCTTDQSTKKIKFERTASANIMSSSNFEHSTRNDRYEGPKRNEKDAFPDKTHAKSDNASDQPPFLFNFDARKLLIEKTKREISKKLEEMRSGASAKAKVRPEGSGKEKEQTNFFYNDAIAANAMPEVNTANSLNIPCPYFHNFDNDRSVVCFKPQQVWAVYDDDDGMPRLYAFIHKIISLNPFRIQLSYLNAKSNSEFASVDWIASGFNKTCGTFMIGRCEVMDTINVFSHVVSVEWGIQGIVRVLPKRGDIWALYRYWSPEWDDTTPTETRRQYEIVEVLDNYTPEQLGVRVIPLDKSAGFRSVYKRQQNAKRWISRNEMFRFSHQVPSRLLRSDETDNLLNGCWDLDPAATPSTVIEPVR